jgi:hypothetical protein
VADGVLILSCLQVGLRNCQKALNSGLCSGFKNEAGTTIGGFANAINKYAASNTGSGSGGSNSGNSGASTINLTGVARWWLASGLLLEWNVSIFCWCFVCQG